MSNYRLDYGLRELIERRFDKILHARGAVPLGSVPQVFDEAMLSAASGRQVRRAHRKQSRDNRLGGPPVNPSRGRKGLSGHPGRRRAQLEGREVEAEERLRSRIARRLSGKNERPRRDVVRRRSGRTVEILDRSPERAS